MSPSGSTRLVLFAYALSFSLLAVITALTALATVMYSISILYLHQIYMATTDYINTVVLRVATPCSVAYVCRRFGGID